MTGHRRSSLLPGHLAGLRLDRALAMVFGDYSRSRIQRSIREGLVRVDGRVADSAMRIAGGERVELEGSSSPPNEVWEADPVAFGLVYEDSELIVIDKRAGLVVHPGAGNRAHTLANGLLHRYPELAGVPRAGIVHRLDKDTSGLLVVARSLAAHRHLVSEMLRRAIEREYDAIVWGRFRADRGSIDAAIARHRSHRTRMSVAGQGRHAVTHFEVQARYPHFTRLRVRTRGPVARTRFVSTCITSAIPSPGIPCTEPDVASNTCRCRCKGRYGTSRVRPCTPAASHCVTLSTVRDVNGAHLCPRTCAR